MAIFNGMNISASGMTAQTMRMDTIAQNLANIDTTRDENGNVYRRKTVVFAEKGNDAFGSALAMQQARRATAINGTGVKVTAIAEDHVTALKKVYDPAHPDADEEGYVTYPNVDTVTEMTNLIDATRSYEANVTAFNATKNMLLKGLEVGQ
ncbi:MAG: flagellar basal body rod protein FlgC [Lachnospiraceae bacterium]|nr:flagellar basal body rod protein FlgC [Lachnospiraceae bacterium]MBR4816208.1 flagellar basal body rod protein FlgC [Lachnospiraceae bacterium]MCR4625258.1 flagellar basal body rod protein FlgC [Lachnospiraceae bacterium]